MRRGETGEEGEGNQQRRVHIVTCKLTFKKKYLLQYTLPRSLMSICLESAISASAMVVTRAARVARARLPKTIIDTSLQRVFQVKEIH